MITLILNWIIPKLRDKILIISCKAPNGHNHPQKKPRPKIINDKAVVIDITTINGSNTITE